MTYPLPSPKVIMTATTPALYAQAKTLAMELKLNFIEYEHINFSTEITLILSSEGLGLHMPQQKKIFYINFQDKKMLFRLNQLSLRKELLAKALGIKPSDNRVIVDATAGLGRDSFVLAALGFQITSLEKSPIVFALLQDALVRAKYDKHLQHIVERICLVQTEASHWLRDKIADVIYLDPMFPLRRKTASVKKEMVILQNLLGKSSNEQELLECAIACARLRVVVKRPRLAPNIADKVPNYAIFGKTSRFDIYLK